MLIAWLTTITLGSSIAVHNIPNRRGHALKGEMGLLKSLGCQGRIAVPTEAAIYITLTFSVPNQNQCRRSVAANSSRHGSMI